VVKKYGQTIPDSRFWGWDEKISLTPKVTRRTIGGFFLL
jgi:hypothetical protein